MKQKVRHNHANRHRAKARIDKWPRKPDSHRLQVLMVNNAPMDKAHTQPRRIVLTTVVPSGKVYPYNSVKRGWPAQEARP